MHMNQRHQWTRHEEETSLVLFIQCKKTTLAWLKDPVPEYIWIKKQRKVYFLLLIDKTGTDSRNAEAYFSLGLSLKIVC